jgi:transposase
MGYSTGSHTIYHHRYHIVWAPKYRFKVLRGEVRLRVRDIIRQVCAEMGVTIINGALSLDHVHMFVEIPPHIAVSEFIQKAKGRSSRKVQQEFEILWGGEQRLMLWQSEVVGQPLRRTAMSVAVTKAEAPAAIQVNLAAIFVSLELSLSKWLVTSLSPGTGEKISRHTLGGGDVPGLLDCLAELQRKTKTRTGQDFPIVTIHEAGLDGFWIHRILEREGIESYVVDPASIATSRRRRRAKTDRIDGEALVKALLAYKRGEPRVCAMVRVPTPEDEDRRRLVRERKALTNERVRHVNRIKGLLYSQGIAGFEPLKGDRWKRLEELATGDGRPLPPAMKAQISRELDRIELLLEQIKVIEKVRDAMLVAAQETSKAPALLLGLKGIGAEFAAVLWSEGLSRNFDNRRQVAAYAGLAPTPWQSGQVDKEQGVSKSGNPRLRTMMIQAAWLWTRHQPDSALTIWFKDRVMQNGGRHKKSTIVALARKLLVALWKYINAGVVIEGAIVKPV